MDQKALAKGVACLRVGFALYILWMMLPNLDRSYLERLPDIIDGLNQTNPFAWYRWVINTLVYPHIQTVGTIISVGAALCGAALIIGFLTRITLMAVTVFTINLMLLAGHISDFHEGFALMLGLLCAGLYICDAGRAYGVDGWIFKEAGLENSNSRKSAKVTSIHSRKHKKAVDTLSKLLKKQSKSNKKNREHDLEPV